jgi:hypothetical protein
MNLARFGLAARREEKKIEKDPDRITDKPSYGNQRTGIESSDSKRVRGNQGASGTPCVTPGDCLLALALASWDSTTSLRPSPRGAGRKKIGE